jgi:hypothetical protein
MRRRGRRRRGAAPFFASGWTGTAVLPAHSHTFWKTITGMVRAMIVTSFSGERRWM